MARKWSHTESGILINNYNTKTIKELLELLPGRDEDAVNCKVKRLKKEGKIKGGKDEDALKRAYDQRGLDSLK